MFLPVALARSSCRVSKDAGTEQFVEPSNLDRSRPPLPELSNDPTDGGQVATVARARQQRYHGLELPHGRSQLILEQPRFGQQDRGLGMLPDQAPIGLAQDPAT